MTHAAAKPVLIVDDDDMLRRLLVRLVERAGFFVTEAASGDAALTRLATEKPSAVLLDVMMPGKDGLEVLTAIRAEAKWRNLPVIMVTAQGDAKALERAIAIGIHDWVVKPPNSDELRSRLARLTRRFTETEIRSLLGRLKMPDEKAFELVIGGKRRQGTSYSVELDGASLRLAMPQSLSPKLLATAPVEQLMKDLAVDVRGRPLWHRLWPEEL